MKVYLAGGMSGEKILATKLLESFNDGGTLSGINVLESFYYLRKNEDFMPLARHFGSFLLDSGAFTFMSGSHKGTVDWDGYVEEYACLINKYDVNLFFELDIDSVVGLQRTEELRHKIESFTGKKPIPVWHKNRGKNYFVKMCEEYPYVAIGGIVTQEIPRVYYEEGFPWFIQTAHEHGCKIHALGYSDVTGLRRYRFDSVDSTTWASGSRYGELHVYKAGTIEKYRSVEKGTKVRSLKDIKRVTDNNFNEWVKFGIYAERNL